LKSIISSVVYLWLVVLSAQAAEFYVAGGGDDANPGTVGRPFATLQRAQFAVRACRRGSPRPEPVEIVLREGVYCLDETLVLTPEDSGTAEAPVTWRAADGETAVLSGGRVIGGEWTETSGGIWFVDMPQAKGWTAHKDVPEVFVARPTGPWNFRQLFVGGRRATRARFPNLDNDPPFLFASGGSLAHVELPSGHVKPAWQNEPDAQINIVANWRFFNQWNDVVDADPKESILQLGPRERHGKIIDGNWFWIEGVRAELDRPGEWYLDTNAGRLYYMPEPGQDPNDLTFVAPNLNRIVYLKGDVERGTHVEHVSFKGLHFRHTTFTLGHIEARVHTDGAILMENAKHCRVENCRFDNIGGYALWLHLDSQYNVFHHNTVVNSGGGGVLMTGARLSYMDDTKVYTPGPAAAKVAPMLNKVTANTVRHCGRIRYYGGGAHMDSRPASMAMLPGNYIAHNHFQDLSRNGIFSFRNQGGHVVEYNHIHDCMQTTIDGACIHFASMNPLAAPNHILSNYLHDIWGYEQLRNHEPRRTLANGVFLDWDTSNTTIKNNYTFNAGGKAFKTIWDNWNLHLADNHESSTRIEPPFLAELGPGGSATHGIRPADLARVGRVVHYTDTDLVWREGAWEAVSATGISNLFRFNFLQARAQDGARITYRMPIEEPGTYLVCLLYKPRDENASNTRLTILHTDGKDTLRWNMRQGNQHGFAVKVGEYRFQPGADAAVTLSNEEADGLVVADAIAYVKSTD